ncbi:alcohol dehydrogenase catalytic domain-containing protein [Pseudonocardia kunmingensis]|uniref:Threonine dehydrogenase-like Zn-dependent dehydrogenase n=1 Tax=Pseudonocardia kunmingensis TaxID=630975 RepID=A0A543DQQ6_9PSEU|nr:alcohol dehydrogenase catalytic domain-containing protein [Pseudonocardia kunmingensis]TQM11665.1 threonine dehydrogenase-like Zn-dependent dehydrogenase [Pseudonocardia kunmingensis]
MHGLVIHAGEEGARLGLADLAEPTPDDADLLVDGIAVGVCGTDRSLLARGLRGGAPGDRLVLGHESLGRVRRAPSGSRFAPGDLVAGLVRRPDPHPCPNCAVGELDICLNGDFTERGIKGRDGYAAERYVLADRYAVAVSPRLGLAGVLVEPASIVAKAWERVDASSRRSGRALVLGAGPIGLLAALLGAQRGYEVHVVDQVGGGPKVRQVKALGAVYHEGAHDLGTALGGTGRGGFDAVVECTGELVAAAIAATGPGGVLCLVAGGHRGTDPTMELSVLSGRLTGGNRTITGVSSSGRGHFEAAHAALLHADPEWLHGLLTTTVPLERYAEAFHAEPDTIKSVILLAADPGPAGKGKS